jgi:hypothetical protein
MRSFIICTPCHIVQVIQMRLAEDVEFTAKIRNVYWILLGKTAGKRPLG